MGYVACYSQRRVNNLPSPPCDNDREANLNAMMTEEEDEYALEALVVREVDPPQSLLLLDSSSSSSSHSYKWAEDSVDSFHCDYQEVDEFYGDGLSSSSPLLDQGIGRASILRRSKVVRFSSVHVREYALTVGDHPRCKGACPLSLSWEYSQRAPANIERYEDSRRIRRRRIAATSFNLDANQRRRRLVSVLGSWGALCRLEMEASRASLEDELEQIFEFESGDDEEQAEEVERGQDEEEEVDASESESESSESDSSSSSSSLFSLSEFPGLDAESLASCMEEDETLVDMISNILASRVGKTREIKKNAPSSIANATSAVPSGREPPVCLHHRNNQ